MTRLCLSDEHLNEFDFSYYQFNTALWRGPFQNRMPKLQDLAAGLATEIELQHAGRRRIYLVAHSLGGLVARQYLVSEIKKGRELKVAGAVLFATPNTGAALAAVGRVLSWNHHQLHQLTNGSDILQILNEDWIHLQVEKRVKTIFISGGNDAVVEASSSAPFIGQLNSKMLIQYGHSDIIEPEHHADIRYRVLQNLLLEGSGLVNRVAGKSRLEKQADPLFEIYDNADRPFYFQRQYDANIKQQLERGAVWVTGSSGVGKTTVLRHIILSAGWKLGQVMLASYPKDNPEALLRAMCVELADLKGSQETLNPAADVPEAISYFRRQLRLTPPDHFFCLVIEEIPLLSHENRDLFLNLLLKLLMSIECDPSVSSRFAIALSSIGDPFSAGGVGMVKLRERVQVISLPQWTGTETAELLEQLSTASGISLQNWEKAGIVEASMGSPRFIKMTLRKLKQTEAPLDRILTIVRQEQL